MPQTDLQLSRFLVRSEVGGHCYLFGGMTGALLKLEPAEAAELGRPVADMSKTLLMKLIACGLVVSSHEAEIDALRSRYAKERDASQWLGLTLVTSLGCNFDCPYCFENKTNSVMSPEVVAGVLGYVNSQRESLRGVHVTWYGGEPLIGKRVIKDLSDRLIDVCDAHGLGYEANIVTNGYLLDLPTVRLLVEKRVSYVQVTLDGPAQVHNLMRPLNGGGGTFARIVANLQVACDLIPIGVRVNMDASNASYGTELLERLSDAGLAGRISVYPAQIVASDSGVGEPSSSYSKRCLAKSEFAELELEFQAIAHRMGFARPTLPSPKSTPCGAVSARNLVVGSRGELYKCWESVGNSNEAYGNICDLTSTAGEPSTKWVTYSPFDDEQCISCIALPVCMGGCAAHAMSGSQRENKCGTFRHNHVEKVAQYVRLQAASDGRKMLPIEPV